MSFKLASAVAVATIAILSFASPSYAAGSGLGRPDCGFSQAGCGKKPAPLKDCGFSAGGCGQKTAPLKDCGFSAGGFGKKKYVALGRVKPPVALGRVHIKR